MNKKILPSVFSVFFLLLEPCGYSQDYDLIVTAKGDSVMCRIDSIADTHIYYQMKSHSKWIHTQIPRSEILEYKQGVIERKKYLYKPGSSIIDSSKPAIPESLYHVRENSVYIGMLSINYARMIPLGQTIGITLGAGIFNFDGWGLLAESTVLLGGIKHFFEPGFMFLYSLEPEQVYSEDGIIVGELSPFGVTIRTGYRYQGPRGLLIRPATNFVFFGEAFWVLPALSLGYSF